MDTSQWPQGIGLVKPMEESSRAMVERSRSRPTNDQALNCPRCNSTNTKFCYYNNYSLSQPRYFCKTCRRYWTEGGSLRNVPVGGGSRKNKRPSSSSPPPPPPPPPPVSSKKLDDLQNPRFHEGQDLNLAYPPPPPPSNVHDYNNTTLPNSIEVTCNKSNPSYMELLNPSRVHHPIPFMSNSVSDSSTVYSSGFPMQDFKPSLNFSLDGFETGYGNLQEDGAKMLFPMEELKQDQSNDGDELEENRGQGETSGYWSGMLGGGHW